LFYLGLSAIMAAVGGRATIVATP